MFRDHFPRLCPPATVTCMVSGIVLSVGLLAAPAHAAEAPVGLGTAGSYAVLAGQSITNTGPSVVSGDIGVGPGTAVSGIPPLVQTGGALHVADAVAIQAQSDLTTAYNSAAGRSTVTDITGSDLGGLTLTTGVVEHTSAMQLTGTLTLDAQGDPSAVFIFKAGSTLITAPNSTVSLINGASPCNVFWQVGSSTTLDTNTTFVGTVMSLTSATLNTGATLQGQMLARNGSITLDTNVISRPNCATTPPTSPSPTPTTTPTVSATPTVSPTATPTPTTTTGGPLSTKSPTKKPKPSPSDGGDSSTGGGSGSGNGGSGNGDSGTGGDGSGTTGGGGQGTPVVPVGHPETGLGGTAQPDGLPGLVLLALLAASVTTAGALILRRRRPVRLH